MRTDTPEHPKTLAVNGIHFHIDQHGFVSHPESGALGHLEDCIEVAETLTALFNLSDEVKLKQSAQA